MFLATTMVTGAQRKNFEEVVPLLLFSPLAELNLRSSDLQNGVSSPPLGTDPHGCSAMHRRPPGQWRLHCRQQSPQWVQVRVNLLQEVFFFA